MSDAPSRFLPEHICEALELEIKAQMPANIICLYNFGSSNVAADTVSSFVFENSTTQVHTIVDRMVPAWVNDSVDVIIMSYSGNNPEIEEVYHSAKNHTSRVHCITSGGILEKLCKEGCDDLQLLPEGLSDAEATGYEIGVLVNLYESLGILNIKKSIMESLPRIIEYRDSIWNSDTSYQLTKLIKDKIPVIYCIGELRAVHKRWKMLINQVLGKLAFSGELPEFDHNEIVSWTEDLDRKDFTMLIFKTDTESEMLNRIVKTVTELLPEYNLDLTVIDIEGRLMERGIKGIILADSVINNLLETQR